MKIYIYFPPHAHFYARNAVKWHGAGSLLIMAGADNMILFHVKVARQSFHGALIISLLYTLIINILVMPGCRARFIYHTLSQLLAFRRQHKKPFQCRSHKMYPPFSLSRCLYLLLLSSALSLADILPRSGQLFLVGDRPPRQSFIDILLFEFDATSNLHRECWDAISPRYYTILLSMLYRSQHRHLHRQRHINTSSIPGAAFSFSFHQLPPQHY